MLGARLKMPRALEELALGGCSPRMECSENTILEASVSIPGEKLALLEGQRIDMSLRTAHLMPPKIMENYDFSLLAVTRPRTRRHAEVCES